MENITKKFERYSEASASHDLTTLEALTAEDIIWQLGPHRFVGKEEALGPNAFDKGAETTLIYQNTRIIDNIVEFKLIETNEIIRAIGMTEVWHFPRFAFENGLVKRKDGSGKKPPDRYSVKELNRRMAPFRQWIRETHPKALSKLLDSEGVFIFSQVTGALMLQLAREWVNMGAPGRLSPQLS